MANVNKQPNIVAEPETSEKTDNAKSDQIIMDKDSKKSETEESSKSAVDGNSSVSSSKPEQTSTIPQETQTSEQIITNPSTEQNDVSRRVVYIYIIENGKKYMQVFNETQYTLDKEIGLLSDFEGCYKTPDDDSKVYTVKEDKNILVVKLADGNSVNLMAVEENNGYYLFNGLRVSPSLKAALSSNDGKVYSVDVTRPDSDDMYSFEYNGKTLGEIKTEYDECETTCMILKWISGQITDEMFLSGRDDNFLDKAETVKGNYRIGGTDEYDIEKAKEDSLAYGIKSKELYYECQTAFHTFRMERITNIYNILTENGVKAEIISEINCKAEMTKEQFEALGTANPYLDEYAFRLGTEVYVTQ
ncbi:MAG: hypothetical protein IIT39_17555 [Clostridia bacterium]|nr:hypothetical protein [Clostridia bacterium]